MKDYYVVTLFFAIVTLAHVQNVCMSMPLGVLLMDEDKRQGLIPFPRVGRTLLSSYFMPNYFGQPEMLEPGSSSPSDSLNGANDVFLRYTRSDRTFTPRLGRRKRSIAEADDYEMDDDRKHYSPTVIELDQLLRKSPWAIITFKGIDKKMAFSPRLGRAMVPRLGRKRSDEEVNKRAAFSPRLGRSHQTSEDLDQFNVETRSAFSPRLGRSSNDLKENKGHEPESQVRVSTSSVQ